MADEAHAWMRRFHLGQESVAGSGVLEVRRGPGALGRFVCVLLRLPRTGAAVPVRVRVLRRAVGVGGRLEERWVRRVGGRALVSVQTRVGERACERHGPVEIRTRTTLADQGIEVVQEEAVLRAGRLRVRVPELLAPRVAARAWVEPDDRARRPPRFHVEVRVTLPVAGRVLTYRGYLAEEPGANDVTVS
ncbi:hypothetical protein Skr01_73380 [Sphaerisporangium krabiense]|uniref:DUF4166 domain-containing protein n=1 Tax=Sphaerisporangium krabiense TaxID=763782 RepID=A0A7W8Z914_9ACTN|nr:DUF4166 domain-containing protein [Sphaerisporangium krabiense]MBB5629595.1 hypothetical protein [Sphaerisporangium krabiense]GII67253.1 hypothetical protein Skr01_73380 [Sphaerisporangium krabiense]